MIQNKIKPAREATICRRRGRKEQGFQYLGMLARVGTMAGLWSRGAHTISSYSRREGRNALRDAAMRLRSGWVVLWRLRGQTGVFKDDGAWRRA